MPTAFICHNGTRLNHHPSPYSVAGGAPGVVFDESFVSVWIHRALLNQKKMVAYDVTLVS